MAHAASWLTAVIAYAITYWVFLRMFRSADDHDGRPADRS
jgi:hypothetical protein